GGSATARLTLADIDRKLDRVLRDQHHLKEMILALTTVEQAAVNDLSAAVETLATDLGQAMTAAQQTAADLRTQVDALQAKGTVDAQTIAELRATVDTIDADVVGALSPITSRL